MVVDLIVVTTMDIKAINESSVRDDQIKYVVEPCWSATLLLFECEVNIIFGSS